MSELSCEHKFVEIVLKEDGIIYIAKKCVNCGNYHSEYKQMKQTKYKGKYASTKR